MPCTVLVLAAAWLSLLAQELPDVSGAGSRCVALLGSGQQGTRSPLYECVGSASAQLCLPFAQLLPVPLFRNKRMSCTQFPVALWPLGSLCSSLPLGLCADSEVLHALVHLLLLSFLLLGPFLLH